MLDLRREGSVFVLHFNAGENRFSPEMNAALARALDEVEAAAPPVALVTTGTGKFYSNGLDVEWMMSHGDQVHGYVEDVLRLIARIVTFPATTVAAVNGHAFGAGALISVSHDFRLMRSDRGYVCMPEIDMKLPLHPGMIAILRARLPKQTLHEVISTGKRWGGDEAVRRGIADEAVSEAELLPRAIALAESLAAKADPIMRTLKRSLYPEVLAAIKGA